MAAVKKPVYGVGINDADYTIQRMITIGYRVDGRPIQKLVWACPFYAAWKGMLLRCYCTAQHKRRPTYIGCSVVEEWKTFSNFKAWMETQEWLGKHLDKDLLSPGNKVYGPTTCVFVSPRVNTFITESNKTRGEYQIGVSKNKGAKQFCARVRDGSRTTVRIGYFKTPEEAHSAWLEAKLKLARELAAELIAEGGDPRVAKAVVARYENYSVSEETR